MSVSSSIVIPTFTLFLISSNGDIANLDQIGSWNNENEKIVDYLHKYADDDFYILAYGDEVLANHLIQKIDLYYSQGLFILGPVVLSTNETEVLNRYLELDIRYILIPSENNPVYSSYFELTKSCSFLNVTFSSSHVAVEYVFENFILYSIGL